MNYQQKLDVLNEIENKYESIYLSLDSDKWIEDAIIKPQYKGIGFRHYGDEKRGYFGLVYLEPVSGSYGEFGDLDLPDATRDIRFLPGGNFPPSSKHFFQWDGANFEMKYMSVPQIKYVFEHIQGLIDKVEYRLNFPRLAGVKEVCEIMGWEYKNRSMVDSYVKKGILPPPIQKLASGPVWLAETVIEIKASRDARKSLRRMNKD
ncbi:helix-turn-helix transcriptional regulator [Paenibacillus elgii]|uniref:helix-turn-helix transcriptional regulator n=1 Tax=Paenibacillus elgii TaxID=189691 RepID=UPI0012FA2272|nr:hypothetical protein [Paenibacillus elgii]